MMESVHIDFAHPESHIEPLVRFLEGLFHTRPELLPKTAEVPMRRVKLRRLKMTSARHEKLAPALEARLHPQVRLFACFTFIDVVSQEPLPVSTFFPRSFRNGSIKSST
jgi:hypothetical protein